MVVGSVALWRGAAECGTITPGRPTAEAGRAQLMWLEEALRLVRDGTCDALTTGPVSKQAIAESGVRRARGFRGHTEWLAQQLGASEVVMAFREPKLTVALVTTHVPLARVPRLVTPQRVASTCHHLAELLRHSTPARPRIVISALNPHAGEGGLLGTEEATKITPGIELARRRSRGIDFVGPMGSETAFRRAAAGDFDGVVAMYHDQATIPCKLMGFGEAVNVTLGLPIVRTSVDHGTGYDIAGQKRANWRGMQQAMSQAAALASSRKGAARKPG